MTPSTPSRVPVLDTTQLDQPTKAGVDALAGMVGFVPNLLGSLAHAPKALQGYLHLEEQLRQSSLPGPTTELIALAIAEHNGCDYCLAAHTKIGSMMGITAGQADAARQGKASDPRQQAVLDLTRALLRTKGRVTDAQLADARGAGVTDADMVEIVAHIGAHTISNYMSRLAAYPIDFPAVRASVNG